jgi:hypothetical protein
LEAVQAEEAQLKAEREANFEPLNRPVSIAKTLSIAVHKDKVQISFMLNNLFAGWRLFVPWVMKGYRDSEDCTTTQTVKALSCVFFGRMHNDRKIFDSGMSSYCNALRLLGSDLKDPKATYEIPAVTNVLSLVIFEVSSAYIHLQPQLID